MVFNDDTPAANVATIAGNLATAHGGNIKHVWSTALKGFSVRMPEAAAIALSTDPRVLHVSENGIGSVFQTTQQGPLPWGLDRIDQIGAVGSVTGDGFTDGTYTYPNKGESVHVYVIDTGIRITHHQFQNADSTSRASVAWDTVDDDDNPNTPTNSDGPGHDGVDCEGHGTKMASMIGGNNSLFSGEPSLGVAKGVTLHSVRSIARDEFAPNPCGGFGAVAEIISGIDWVAAHAIKPAVANMSFGCHGFNSDCNRAVRGGVTAGLTMVAAAGNYQSTGRDASLESPASEPQAITVAGSTTGSTTTSESRHFQSNFGSLVDLFAPGQRSPGASISSDSAITPDPAVSGTSVSAAFVSGVAAMYLHDHPDGTASLPWVVEQVIKSNANICPYNPLTAPCTTVGMIANRGSSNTRDRLLNMSFLTELPANPVYNQRFFVWQHYEDFLARDPDEQGLDFWTRNITGNCFTVTNTDILAHVNGNNTCTRDYRKHTALAFWVDPGGIHMPPVSSVAWFTSSNGLAANIVPGESSNTTFVKECYRIYLQRPNPLPDDVTFWVNNMSCYGHPACDNNPSDAAGVEHIIDAFLVAADYELRFGPHS